MALSPWQRRTQEPPSVARRSVFDRDVLPLDNACFLQALGEFDGTERRTAQWYRRLLRASGEWPYNRSAAN